MPQAVYKAAGYAVLPVWTLTLTALLFGRDRARPVISLEAFDTLLALSVLLSLAWIADSCVQRAYRAGKFYAHERQAAYIKGMQDAFGGLHEVDPARPAAPVTPFQRKQIP